MIDVSENQTLKNRIVVDGVDASKSTSTLIDSYFGKYFGTNQIKFLTRWAPLT